MMNELLGRFDDQDNLLYEFSVESGQRFDAIDGRLDSIEGRLHTIEVIGAKVSPHYPHSVY
jgi:hypothetical protein